MRRSNIVCVCACVCVFCHKKQHCSECSNTQWHCRQTFARIFCDNGVESKGSMSNTDPAPGKRLHII